MSKPAFKIGDRVQYRGGSHVGIVEGPDASGFSVHVRFPWTAGGYSTVALNRELTLVRRAKPAKPKRGKGGKR